MYDHALENNLGYVKNTDLVLYLKYLITKAAKLLFQESVALSLRMNSLKIIAKQLMVDLQWFS